MINTFRKVFVVCYAGIKKREQDHRNPASQQEILCPRSPKAKLTTFSRIQSTVRQQSLCLRVSAINRLAPSAPPALPEVSLAAFIQIIQSIARATVLSTVALVPIKNVCRLKNSYHLRPVMNIHAMDTGATTRQIQSHTV